MLLLHHHNYYNYYYYYTTTTTSANSGSSGRLEAELIHDRHTAYVRHWTVSRLLHAAHIAYTLLEMDELVANNRQTADLFMLHTHATTTPPQLLLLLLLLHYYYN